MTFTDYLGFASMTILLVGAANWGTVAIRYAAGALPKLNDTAIVNLVDTNNFTVHELYKEVPTPDLLDLICQGSCPEVQMIVYWAVFASGLFYLLLFVWNSVELQTVEA